MPVLCPALHSLLRQEVQRLRRLALRVLEQAVRVRVRVLARVPRAPGLQQGLAPLPVQPQRRALRARLLGLGLRLPLRPALPQ